MGASQRRKGAKGELEACRVLEEHFGTKYRRNPTQSRRSGGTRNPDIVPVDPNDEHGPPPESDLHLEVKYQRRPELYPALAQAVKDKGPGDVPVVMARGTNGHMSMAGRSNPEDSWVFLLYVSDFDTVARELGYTHEDEVTEGTIEPEPALERPHTPPTLRTSPDRVLSALLDCSPQLVAAWDSIPRGERLAIAEAFVLALERGGY